jgi:hypothetical protein
VECCRAPVLVEHAQHLSIPNKTGSLLSEDLSGFSALAAVREKFTVQIPEDL